MNEEETQIQNSCSMNSETEDIDITSTSRHSADCAPIVLRTSDRIRLVFLPMLVDNPRNKDACLKGSFIYQRKKKDAEWENIKDIDLNQLKSGEGVRLEIKSGELHHFLKHCADFYRIYKKEGIPFGQNKFIKLSSELNTLGNISDAEFRQFLELNKSIGFTTVSRFIKWLAESDQTDEIIQKLEELEINSLSKLNAIIGLSSIKKCLQIWEANKTNDDEDFWQKIFCENYFILSSIFPFPIILVEDKAYMGGKSLKNTGGNLVDFLYKNNITGNAVLIEIKTPATPILGRLYRNDIYNISGELSGATVQASNYSYTFSKEYLNLAADKDVEIQSFKPTCVVLIGNATAQLDDEKKQKSFELYRNGQKDVQIITYDELFEKIRGLEKLLEGQQERPNETH